MVGVSEWVRFVLSVTSESDPCERGVLVEWIRRKRQRRRILWFFWEFGKKVGRQTWGVCVLKFVPAFVPRVQCMSTSVRQLVVPRRRRRLGGIAVKEEYNSSFISAPIQEDCCCTKRMLRSSKLLFLLVFSVFTRSFPAHSLLHHNFNLRALDEIATEDHRPAAWMLQVHYSSPYAWLNLIYFSCRKLSGVVVDDLVMATEALLGYGADLRAPLIELAFWIAPRGLLLNHPTTMLQCGFVVVLVRFWGLRRWGFWSDGCGFWVNVGFLSFVPEELLRKLWWRQGGRHGSICASHQCLCSWIAAHKRWRQLHCHRTFFLVTLLFSG